MQRNQIIQWLFCWFILAFSWSFGQQVIDSRGTGMAFSNGADTRGLGHVGLNPATLALQNDFNFEFNLISANIGIFNNSFNKNDYDKYLTSGDFLTADDVNDILDLIPDDGLRVDGFAKVNTLAFYVQNYSLSLIGLGGGFLNAPHDAFELPLTGNQQPGRVYNFDDSDGSGWGGLGISFSGAYPIHQLAEKYDFLDFISAGLTFKYLSGLFYGEILQSQAQLQDSDPNNQNPYMQLDGNAEIISSQGGKGIAADLGTLVRFNNQKWSVGITFLNVFGSINWDNETEKEIISFRGDSLELAGVIDDLLEEDIEFIGSDPRSPIRKTVDTTITLSSYSGGLPKALDIAAAYRWRPDVLVTAEYEQGLNNRLEGTTAPRIALGIEYTTVNVMPLRGGISLGGKMKTSLALGIGLNLKYWILDIAYLNHGSLFPNSSSKGTTLGVTTRFRF